MLLKRYIAVGFQRCHKRLPQLLSFCQLKPLLCDTALGSIVPLSRPIAAVTGLNTDPGTQVDVYRLYIGRRSVII